MNLTDTLTPRQLDVLRLLARGLSNKNIARQLVLEGRTVERHIQDIRMRLDMTDMESASGRVQLSNLWWRCSGELLWELGSYSAGTLLALPSHSRRGVFANGNSRREWRSRANR